MEKYSLEKYTALISENDRVVEVLCRGTDYVRLRPKGHPIQPSVKQVISKVKEIMQKYNCNKLYVATEDVNVWNAFKQDFDNKTLITITEKFLDYKEGFIAENIDKKLDKIQYGMNYFASMVILSKCNCLIAGITSGTAMVSIMANGAFEYAHYYDLGFYK